MMALRGNKGSGNIESRDEWETPQWIFDILYEQYGFTFDCCANKENRKHLWFSDDFLNVKGNGQGKFIESHICWMNPPFSKAHAMFTHFFKVVKRGVAIYRCDNLETKLWQNIILKNANWILIPNKRINYEGMNSNNAVFPSALIGVGLDIPQGLKGTILKVLKKEAGRNDLSKINNKTGKA